MKNIKMIVTDYDGTLLDDQKRLPAGLEEILQKLQERNIRFTVASGRQFYNIHEVLVPTGFADQVDYIAENGGITGYGSKITYCDRMDSDALYHLLDVIRDMDGVYPIFCAKDSAYYEDTDPEFVRNVEMYNLRNRKVPDLREWIPRDEVCKVALYCCNHDAETFAFPVMKKYAGPMQIVLSGDCWVDVMNASVSKGNALKKILDRYQIAPENVMAFGDYLNDLSLLEICGYPFSMDNGHPLLREKIPASGGSNNDGGVVKTIRRELGIS